MAQETPDESALMADDYLISECRQVMPRTYEDLQRQLGSGADTDAIEDKITAGAAYPQQTL